MTEQTPQADQPTLEGTDEQGREDERTDEQGRDEDGDEGAGDGQG